MAYLANMLDTQDLDYYIRANNDGRVYLQGENIRITLQEVLDKSLKVLSYREKGRASTKDYFVTSEKVNAITHEMFEKRISSLLPKKKLEWKIKGLSNSDLNKEITGATREEKVKFFGIPLWEIEQELSRDEYVTYGTETDFFEVFERKIHTDLTKLVNDSIIDDLGKFDQMVDQVKEMGKPSWEEEQNNRSWFSKLFGDSVAKGMILDNILFRRGLYQLMQKSHKEGTDLATELRKIYAGFENEGTASVENKEAIDAVENFTKAIQGLQNNPEMQNLFTNMETSSLTFGVMVSGFERGSSAVPQDSRELIDSSSETITSFMSSKTVQNWEEWNVVSSETTSELAGTETETTW